MWDTGIGIAADQLDAIFEEFYRVRMGLDFWRVRSGDWGCTSSSVSHSFLATRWNGTVGAWQGNDVRSGG